MTSSPAVLVAALAVIMGPAVLAEGLKINILNYASVSPPLLRLATETADQVFQKAGVTVDWCDWEPRLQRSPCATGALHMLLITGAMRSRLGLRGEMLGMALIASDGRTGDSAYVFADNVSALAAEETAPDAAGFARLLGSVIVHETGHLLLGAGNHRPHSVMTGRWGVSELRWALQGALTFASEHAARLRAKAGNRVRTSSSVKASASSLSSPRTRSSASSETSTRERSGAAPRSGESPCAPSSSRPTGAASQIEKPSQTELTGKQPSCGNSPARAVSSREPVRTPASIG